jgi:hypothetical protein
MRESDPLGRLPRNGEPFYFDREIPDYVYKDGISLTCADYRDAVLAMRGARPGDFERGHEAGGERHGNI